MNDIIKKVLCRDDLPKEDDRGNPKCYGGCRKGMHCTRCVVKEGIMKRNRRSDLFGNKLWEQDSRMTYTSYSSRERSKDVLVEPNNQMSQVYQHSVHPL